MNTGLIKIANKQDFKVDVNLKSRRKTINRQHSQRSLLYI